MSASDHRARLKEWLASGEARLHPASFPQRELWENSPVAVADCANHICAFLEVKGAFSRDEGAAAVQKVVDRHEVLRLSFLPGKDGPIQLVRSASPAAFSFRELSPAEAEPDALEALMRTNFHQPFDLLQGPLYRIEMLRRSPTDHVLAFAIHHAIADGWSLGVFVQDLATAYVTGLTTRPSAGSSQPVRPPGLPPVPQSYSEWAASERAFWQPSELAPRADFWRRHLDGARRLWSDHPASATGSGPLTRWICALPAAPTRAIKELATRQSATLFSTLLAAFQVTLWKWTGHDDITVGSPVANRNREIVRQTMGYFAGVVPLRGRVTPRDSFATHLRTTQETTVNCFTHAMPFAELARLLDAGGGPGHHPIFDVRFALQNHPVPDVQLPRMSTRLHMRSTGTARFDLACEITESGEQLEVVWLYRPSMFSTFDLADLDRVYRSVLGQIAQHPDASCADVVP